MTVNIKHLPNDVEALKQLLLESTSRYALLEKSFSDLKEQCERWALKYQHLVEQIKLAQQQRFSSSSESHLLQLDFFDEADIDLETDASKEPETMTVAYERRKTNQPRRKALPAHFPRQEIFCDIDESEKYCACGDKKIRMGEAITEQLDVVPARMIVKKYIRPKYACKACQEHVSIAPMPRLFLPKSLAAPGLVAEVVVRKYVDHLPLYRQSQIWKRLGVDCPRSSLCDWVMAAAKACEPLYLLLLKRCLSASYVQSDETTLQVLKEKAKSNTSKSYLWVYRSEPREGPVLWFEYQASRSGKVPQERFKGYAGYLQTDGYQGYDFADQDESPIVHVCCWDHARRPFAQLVKLAKNPGKAHQILSFINKLYGVEREIKEKGFSNEEKKDYRQRYAKPILEKLKPYLEKTVLKTPEASTLGKGITYILKRWKQLTRYLEAGELHISNILIENAIRPFAIGRKNWLFAGSPNGAKAGAILYTLIQTAKANQKDPHQYLKFVFDHIRQAKHEKEYEKLLPMYFSSEEKTIIANV